MKLSKSQLKEAGSRRILTIEVPAEEIKRVRETAVAMIQDSAQIKGFRAGKAPREIIEKQFRKEIEGETIEHAVQEAYHTALQEHGLSPISQAKIDNVQFDREGPLSFIATMDVRPQFDLPVYKGVQVKKPKVAVTDQDVQMVLETLQHQRAEYEPVTDRSAKEGDVVVVDLKGMLGLQMLPKISESNASFVIGGKSFEQIEQALTGAKTGEERRTMVPIPADHPDEMIRGKEVTFYATLKEIKAPKLPPLDETFVKAVSGVESMDLLKKQIQEQLTHERERASREAAKKQLLTHLVKTVKVEPPESMVQAEFDRMIHDLVHQLEQRGTSLDKVPAAEQAEIKKRYWEMAQDRVRGSLVIEEIAVKEKLIPDEPALEELVKGIQQSPQVDPKLKEHLNTARGRSQLQYDLAIERTFDWLMTQAKVEEVDLQEFQKEMEHAHQ